MNIWNPTMKMTMFVMSMLRFLMRFMSMNGSLTSVSIHPNATNMAAENAIIESTGADLQPQLVPSVMATTKTTRPAASVTEPHGSSLVLSLTSDSFMRMAMRASSRSTIGMMLW